MEKISVKKQWISTSGWRGYLEPINAVCGANCTGDWDDSPCPTKVTKSELLMAKKVLRSAKIPYKQTVCQSSNVFCVHVYLCVPASKKEPARELIKPLIPETRLLYLC